MDVGWQYKLVILVFLFFLSAFFSGSEVALFSINKKKIKNLFGSSELIERYITYLIEYPRRLLVTILIGNTLVNVAASIISVSIALDVSGNTNLSESTILTIQIISLTILIVLFGELTPKVWASKNVVRFSKLAAVPLYWTSIVLYPVAESITELIRLSILKLKFDKTKSVILPEEITDLASISHERGTIEEDEHELIQSIVSFRIVSVHEVMTPRVDIVSLSIDTDFNDVEEVIKSMGHSRIPLYKNSLDDIIGIIYAKDILPYIRDISLQNQLSLAKIARKAMFVPESKLINDLLHEFQEKKTHIAIVVDEFGGTAGLITMEDILEEIVGEIRDEYDEQENPISKIDEGNFLVLGKIDIDELNELSGTEIIPKNSDYETIGGFILTNAGHIPKEGYSFINNNYKFTVKEVLNKRIKKVQIEKLHGE